jgi:antitoxin CptB
MNQEQRKARIRWHSRRGMLELDLLLGRFLDAQLDSMSANDMDRFEELLTQADPDLYAWLMGYETSVDKELANFVTRIRSFYHPTALD